MAWPLLVSLEGAWPVLVAIVGVAWVIGIVFGMARMPGVLAAASMADRAIGRSDHIRSALELAPRERGDAFVAILLRDAERAASESEPARVVSIALGRSWALGGVLLVAACCAVVWLPARSIDRDRTVARADPAAARVASEVARAAQEVRAVSEATGPAISKRDAERLADIERELREGGMRSEDARAEAASTTASLAERAEREADQNRVASERLRDLASAASRTALDAGRESEQGGEAEADAQSQQALDPRLDALLRSLAGGDVGKAADLARELAEHAESLSPEERSRMAEQLDALARAIESEAARSAQAMGENAEAERGTGSSAREQERQPEGEQGQTNPDRGVEEADPIDAAADASEREQRERERDVEEQGSRTAERDAKSIAEAARQAADELRKPASEDVRTQEQRAAGESSPESERKPEGSPEQGAGAGAEQRAADAQGDSRSQSGAREDQGQSQQDQAAEKKEGGAEGEAERSGGEQAAERERGAGEGGEQRTGSDQAAGHEERAGGEGGRASEQGAQEQGQAEQGESGQKQGGQEQGAQGSDDRAQQGDQRTGSREQGGAQSERSRRASGNQGQSEQGESGEQQGERRQGAEGVARESERGGQGEQGERSSQQSERQGDEPGEPSRGAPSGLERFQQALRNAAERNADARRQQEAAERLREVSERLASGGEPEEGERGASRGGEREDPRSGSGLERFAGEGRQGPPGVPQRAGSGPTSIEEVKGPRDDGSNRGGRVAGERPSELSAPREMAPITPGALREAASGIERAIEQQSVPDRRSDLVRRVFQRYRDRAEAQPGSLPSSDGQ